MAMDAAKDGRRTRLMTSPTKKGSKSIKSIMSEWDEIRALRSRLKTTQARAPTIDHLTEEHVIDIISRLGKLGRVAPFTVTLDGKDVVLER
jgi:hypothetical protein